MMFSKAELVLDDGSKKASWTFGPILQWKQIVSNCALGANRISCINDFTWLQCISSLIPAIIAWCYWPGVKESAKMC